MRIIDPYCGPGTYRKAQLHCHTRRSDGRYEPDDLALRYRDAGYSFVCFTDHNVLTRCTEVCDREFVALPGVEETISWCLPPLGPHLGRLMVDHLIGRGSARARIAGTLEMGGVPSLHHPSWSGNLWTGSWPAATLERLPGPFLVEIWNPHSDSDEDTRRWARAVRAHGPEVTIGGVAADDCHRASQFNRGWIMVRVQDITASALRAALLSGAFYASTGVDAEFAARNGAVTVESSADHVTIFDAVGTVRATVARGSMSYEPFGDEGFVRIECRAGGTRCAWSQAFWIMPRSARAIR